MHTPGHCVCPYVAAGLCMMYTCCDYDLVSLKYPKMCDRRKLREAVVASSKRLNSRIFCHPGRFCVTACLAFNSQATYIVHQDYAGAGLRIGVQQEVVLTLSVEEWLRIEAILPITASLKTPPQNRSRHLANQKRSWTGYRQVGWKHL